MDSATFNCQLSSGGVKIVTNNLDDFEIPRPHALFLKLAETIEITTVFTLHPGQPGTPIELPDWELTR